MAGMTLVFISQGQPGGEVPAIGTSERRIIRSHVMRGKNAGRPRPSTRPKRQTAMVHVRRILSLPGAMITLMPRPRALLWNDLYLTPFPQEFNPESTRLMHRCDHRPVLSPT